MPAVALLRGHGVDTQFPNGLQVQRFSIIARRSSGDLAKAGRELIEAQTQTSSLSQVRAERDRSEAQLLQVRAERDAAEAQLSQVRTERDGSKAQLLQVRAEHDAAEAQLSQVRAERDGSEAQLLPVRAERDAAEAQLSQVRTERDAILASTSWRASAPFRWLKQRWLKPERSVDTMN